MKKPKKRYETGSSAVKTGWLETLAKHFLNKKRKASKLTKLCKIRDRFSSVLKRKKGGVDLREEEMRVR